MQIGDDFYMHEILLNFSVLFIKFYLFIIISKLHVHPIILNLQAHHLPSTYPFDLK